MERKHAKVAESFKRPVEVCLTGAVIMEESFVISDTLR
jgi:hypothetical protein